VQSKETIAEAWLVRVMRTCPHAEFLASEKDPFRNPVGDSMRKAVPALLDELLLGMNKERIAAALDPLMQILAVQDLPPSGALAFLFQLKDVLRLHEGAAGGVELLEGRIDEMALVAFDVYMSYRERTYRARTNEARRRVFVMEERLRPQDRAAWQEVNHE
jgi:hypothetical protein